MINIREAHTGIIAIPTLQVFKIVSTSIPEKRVTTQKLLSFG